MSVTAQPARGQHTQPEQETKVASQGKPAACTTAMLLVTPAAAGQALAQGQPTHAGHTGHEGMPMAMDDQTQMDAAHQRKLLADKKESEFNHHLAGFFVILAGVFILAEGTLTRRWSFLRFAWPACFLLSGLFLLVFSDTELWPFGPQSWWYGLTNHLEVLQHKSYAVILLVLGILEVQRARGVSKSIWAKWLFPVLACFGSAMLLFHEHHTGMHGADHMTTMTRIQAQHQSFAATGFGIGVFKGLSELPSRWQAMFAKLWALPMIVLGVLLMRYTE
jgi:putative copper resistance protein D